MARRVDPEAYRKETPIFSALLWERDGRFPGTPEGEEELPEVVLTQEVPEDVQDAQAPAQGLLSRVVPVSSMAIQPVTPVLPEADPEKTQAMPVPLFVEPDEED